MGTWTREIFWLSLIISYLGLFSRVVLVLSLPDFLPINPLFFYSLLQLLPLIVLNQLFVFSINSSIFVVENVLPQNENLRAKVDTYLNMRGILFNDEDEIKSGTSLEKPKLSINNAPKPPFPNQRPFWHHSRFNYSRSNFFVALTTLGVTSVAAIVTVNLQLESNRIARSSVEATNRATDATNRATDIAERQMDKVDLSKSAYDKKWLK